MKKILFYLIFCLFVAVSAIQAQAVDTNISTESSIGQPVNIYFFYGQGCPHCADEEVFLDKLEAEYGNQINILRYETWYNQDNVELLKKAVAAHKLNVTGVPVTLIGQKGIIGFADEASTGKQIRQALETCVSNGCTCPADDVLGNNDSNTQTCEVDKDARQLSTVVNLPFIGQKDLAEYSLPALSVVLGTIDGFNPCAMWVLIFLITMLLGIQSKKRRWLFGIIFIVASGGVYFTFMAAWLNFLMFLGYVQWIRVLIGVFAIISGIMFLRDFRKNDGTCKVTKHDSRKKIFDRIKDIVKNKNILFAIFGLIILAFTVNLVELACSLGFPAVYTQLLALANLPAWEYYSYIFVYIFFFMIDDIIVFVIAMLTMQVTGLSSKYARYSSLVGGILIFIIGLILILKPEWLMFG
ncbi:MAG: thioredoxin family protein [Patescibacteria group bacterium]